MITREAFQGDCLHTKAPIQMLHTCAHTQRDIRVWTFAFMFTSNIIARALDWCFFFNQCNVHVRETMQGYLLIMWTFIVAQSSIYLVPGRIGFVHMGYSHGDSCIHGVCMYLISLLAAYVGICVCVFFWVCVVLLVVNVGWGLFIYLFLGLLCCKWAGKLCKPLWISLPLNLAENFFCSGF